MIRFVGNQIRRIRAVILWIRALDRASKGQHVQSLELLKSIYAMYGVGAPSPKVYYDINVLLAHTACRLDDHQLAIDAVRTALRQLHSGVRGLSNFDKDYLRYYCKAILEYCSMQTGFETFQDSRSIELTFDSLRLDKVRSDLKRHFPVTRPVESERIERSQDTQGKY